MERSADAGAGKIIEKKKWRVEARSVVISVAHVEAESEEEANELADNLSEGAFDYDREGSALVIIGVEPAEAKE